MTKRAMLEVAAEVPAPMATVHKRLRRVLVRRALLVYLCAIEGRQPRSFITRVAAGGSTWVQERLTVEQRLEILRTDIAHQSSVLTGEAQVKHDEKSAEAAHKVDADRACEETSTQEARKGLGDVVAEVLSPRLNEMISPRLDPALNNKEVQGALSSLLRMQEALFVAVQSQSQLSADLLRSHSKLDIKLHESQAALQAQLKGISQTVEAVKADILQDSTTSA